MRNTEKSPGLSKKEVSLSARPRSNDAISRPVESLAQAALVFALVPALTVSARFFESYILSHGVSEVDWLFYKHLLPEHIYDVYIEHWKSVAFTLKRGNG